MFGGATRGRRAPVPVRVLLGVLTVIGCLPLLGRLPQVTVVACLDAGLGWYAVVPSQVAAGPCLSAPAPVVRWTVLVAATLLVQLVLLPALLAGLAAAASGLRRFAVRTRLRLAAVLDGPTRLVSPSLAPVLVPVAAASGTPWRRSHPRRGPPAELR